MVLTCVRQEYNYSSLDPNSNPQPNRAMSTVGLSRSVSHIACLNHWLDWVAIPATFFSLLRACLLLTALHRRQLLLYDRGRASTWLPGLFVHAALHQLVFDARAPAFREVVEHCASSRGARGMDITRCAEQQQK